MSHDPIMEPPEAQEYGKFSSYLIGFLASIILTLIAYYLTVERAVAGFGLDLIVGFLAIIQAIFQLVLFLNLTKEPKPRWNLMIFLFMILVVAIIVFGSIWIMYNLNYNLMP